MPRGRSFSCKAQDAQAAKNASYLVLAARDDTYNARNTMNDRRRVSPASSDAVSSAFSDQPIQIQKRQNRCHHDGKSRQSVGFWHDKMSKVRGHVLLQWIRTIWIVVLFMLAVLALAWGALSQTENQLGEIVVPVVDFDGQFAPYDEVEPIVGPAMAQIAMNMAASPTRPSLGFTVVSPSRFNNDPSAVRQSVYDWSSWAAIIIQPNATALLLEAIQTGNSSYDPRGSVQYIVQSARQESTYFRYIAPELDALTTQFSAEFGATWSLSIMSNLTLSPQVMALAPAAVNPGIIPLQLDLRPFHTSATMPVFSLGPICLIIVAFFSFFSPIHTRFIQKQGQPPLHFRDLIIWRWTATIGAYFFISLAYSFVPLAFQVPFQATPVPATDVGLGATAYGSSSFVVFWLVNFLGMIAFGIACENVSMVAGQPWAGLWLVFWVVTNVVTAVQPIELAPSFFRWGYAWPLHQVVEASRHILFGLDSRMGLNVGVLLVWVAINTALFPLCCYYMRWKTEKDRREIEAEDEDRFFVRTIDDEEELSKSEV